tara:strand:+ start:211 stop:393 length:183 start_codon:yes stop_codon:yes gene_type:complete
MKNELDAFIDNVIDESNSVSVPDAYVAKYLEEFVRILYGEFPEVREKIALINNLVDNPDC